MSTRGGDRRVEGTPRLSVVIADDNEWIRSALKTDLEPFFEIRASVGDGNALIDAVVAQKPDAVVADLWMPGFTGVDAMRALRRLGSTARFVIISADPDARAHCLRAGAAAFVCKAEIAGELVRAVLLACGRRLDGGAVDEQS